MKLGPLILFFSVAFVAVPPPAEAGLLGSDLESFAVLGASTVTNTGATTLTGNLGVWSSGGANAITGQSTITINGEPALTTGAVFVHAGDALAENAQGQLTTARTNLGLLGPGTLIPSAGSVDLAGLTLTPGVYTVNAGVSNLTGTLTLDGLGDANAFWLFQMPTTLITSPGSVVNVINAGAGSGLFWNVGSSATLGTTTSFQGNILALTSITLNTGAIIECGRALADNGAVTMDANTIDAVCADTGSNGLSGSGLRFDDNGNVVPVGPTGGPTAVVPEPGSFVIFGACLAGLFGFRKRFLSAA